MQFWQKIQRNHGLEHGTISLLMSRGANNQAMAGYSIPGGFLVLGNVTMQQVSDAAAEALARMKAGESDLAISPFCGTNIVVGAALTTMGTLLGYRLAGGGSPGVSRAFSNAALAIVASRPVGRMVQRLYTTSSDVGDMQIEGVSYHQLGKLTAHWVATTFA
jgi:hypothetical protein